MLNVLNPEWAPGDKPAERMWEEAYRRYEIDRDLARCRRQAFARKLLGAFGAGRAGAVTAAAARPASSACADPCDQEPCMDGGLAL